MSAADPLNAPPAAGDDASRPGVDRTAELNIPAAPAAGEDLGAPPSMLPLSPGGPAPLRSATPEADRPGVFASEARAAPEALGRAAALDRLAELAAHRGAETPLSIALTGEAGAGKSYALRHVCERAQALSALARRQRKGPFLPGLAFVRLEAEEAAAGPARALAEKINARLLEDYPTLAGLAAEETAALASDPRALARQAGEALDGARKRLAAERRALDEAEAGRARLAETLIYGEAGGGFDAWARANRGSIEPGLRAFGFRSPDPLDDYRGLVHTLTETGGPAGRLAASLRGLWAYRGQPARLAWIVFFAALIWLCGAAARDQSWLSPVAGAGESGKTAAEWVVAHMHMFGWTRWLAQWGLLIALASLLWRAWRFAQPLWRGAALLDQDVATRRGELERRIAHGAQRVEALAREAETLETRAAEAERRAGGPQRAVAPPLAFLALPRDDEAAARCYLTALDGATRRLARKTPQAAPGRILVALDGLERLPAERAREILTRLSALTALPGFALVATAPAEAFGDGPALAELDRAAQVAFRLTPAPGLDWRPFVKGLALPADAQEPVAPENRSALDEPVGDDDQRLLCELAPLAGPSPRRVARLFNIWRLARGPAAPDNAALALALAVRLGADDSERAEFLRLFGREPAASQENAGEETVPLAAETLQSPRLRAAFAAAGARRSLTAPALRRADALARQWTLRP